MQIKNINLGIVRNRPNFLFMNFNGIVGSSVYAFLFGHYHFHSFNSLISILCIGFILFYFFKYKRLNSNLILVLIILISVFLLSFTTIFLENYNLKSLINNNNFYKFCKFVIIFQSHFFQCICLTK